MRPELQLAMRKAIELGPGHCPPDLFAGAIPQIVSGLKMHSATIAQARRKALEDSFPRTLKFIGAEAFDALAARYIGQERVLRLPLDSLGGGFPAMLDGPARYLARIEWAWLESYCAAEAQPLDLASLVDLSPHRIVALPVRLHPAARLVASGPGRGTVTFDGAKLGAPGALITRPGPDVQIAQATAPAVKLVRRLKSARSLGDLLGTDADAVAFLVERGALTCAGEN